MLDGYELFQGDILMTDDIRKELRDMGLYPSNDNKLRDSQITPTKRSKRAAISSHARRWIGPSGVPEIPYQLEASVRKWADNFISNIPFDLFSFSLCLSKSWTMWREEQVFSHRFRSDVSSKQTCEKVMKQRIQRILPNLVFQVSCRCKHKMNTFNFPVHYVRLRLGLRWTREILVDQCPMTDCYLQSRISIIGYGS